MAQINTYSEDGLSRLCVQYDRLGAVTLGMQRTKPEPLIHEGKPVIVDGAPVSNDVFDDLSGEWMPVDRSGVNTLIRSLREARDKAFGKDE